MHGKKQTRMVVGGEEMAKYDGNELFDGETGILTTEPDGAQILVLHDPDTVGGAEGIYTLRAVPVLEGRPLKEVSLLDVELDSLCELWQAYRKGQAAS